MNHRSNQTATVALSDHACPLRCDNVLIEREDDLLMLLREGAEQAVVLNETSQVIWQLSDGTTTIEAMIELLDNAFAVPRAELQHDVLTAIAALIDHNLIVIR